MSELDRVHHKLRRLRRIEAGYRADLRRALERSRAETVDPIKAKERLERVRAKHERRMDKVLHRIKALTSREALLKSGRAGKG
ncbi:MAG TPA: hypothetical protein VJ326_06620 [Thermoplasmata archaeon]|nr:hypothetical protein [Thermoplasmata archaeon]